ICWLYGPAGAGKSAIAQTLAEICVKKGLLIGSFFFWGTDPSRNNPSQLFTTIALQLATSIPALRSIIDSVVMKNPMVLTSSIEIQFEQLILQPCDTLNDIGSSSPSNTPILIIDGLDEC
ncbi:hypothetical protein GYMLUDRAFT_109672, partial [Collybiopsis luxurians FD-317 M1]